MKKIILAIFLLTGFFSNNLFAQRDAGGSSDGSGAIQPCATSFVRNNGNGTCDGQAQIRLYFTQAPIYAPTLENIIYNGEPLLTNGMPITGNISDLATLGYVSYCLPTSNIPAAVKLTLVLKYNSSAQEDCILSGTN